MFEPHDEPVPQGTRDFPVDDLPLIPDAADAPAGSMLLVRVRDEPAVREVKSQRQGSTRIALAHLWTQGGERFWVEDIARLDPAKVVSAMLLTPDTPFGSVAWVDLTREERATFYWGAAQTLAARPNFERTVADAWVRAALKRDETQPSNSGSLTNRLRRDAMADARATIGEKLAASVDIEAVVRATDATKVMLDWLRSTAHDGGKSKFWALIRQRIDANVAHAVGTELDAQLGGTFDYLRSSMGMAVNNAIGRLGAARNGRLGGGNG